MGLRYTVEFPDGQGHHFDVKQVLSYGSTDVHNEVGIFVTTGGDKVLVINGREQSNSRVIDAYHSALVKPLLCVVDRAEKHVLVLGTGPGAAIRILLDAGWGHVTGVDIDPHVQKLAKDHMPEWWTYQNQPDGDEGETGGVFTDDAIPKRVNLINGDVREVVKNIYLTPTRFSGIVYDLSEPDGDPCAVFSKEFFNDVALLLKSDGIFCAQVGYAGIQGKDTVTEAVRLLNSTWLKGGDVLVDTESLWTFYHFTRVCL